MLRGCVYEPWKFCASVCCVTSDPSVRVVCPCMCRVIPACVSCMSACVCRASQRACCASQHACVVRPQRVSCVLACACVVAGAARPLEADEGVLVCERRRPPHGAPHQEVARQHGGAGRHQVLTARTSRTSRPLPFTSPSPYLRSRLTWTPPATEALWSWSSLGRDRGRSSL